MWLWLVWCGFGVVDVFGMIVDEFYFSSGWWWYSVAYGWRDGKRLVGCVMCLWGREVGVCGGHKFYEFYLSNWLVAGVVKCGWRGGWLGCVDLID